MSPREVSDFRLLQQVFDNPTAAQTKARLQGLTRAGSMTGMNLGRLDGEEDEDEGRGNVIDVTYCKSFRILFVSSRYSCIWLSSQSFGGLGSI